MKPACLLVLASVVVSNLTVSGGQELPAEDETERRTIDDIILQRAESILLRSILKKMRDEDERNEELSSQPEWVTKRQHPGKRFGEDLEKRQHPGRRDEDAAEDPQLLRLDVQRRQHPGKRNDDDDDDEMRPSAGLQKRQHPGKRSATPRIPVALLRELSKRQHPGKRYLLAPSKRQHPGKRRAEDEGDEEDEDAEDEEEEEEEEERDGDAGWEPEGEEDLPGLEKRQHPGKRSWDNSDFGANGPCGVSDPASCGRGNLLLDFLESIHKGHAEEKRQHPGKRFAPEEEPAEAE